MVCACDPKWVDAMEKAEDFPIVYYAGKVSGLGLLESILIDKNVPFLTVAGGAFVELLMNCGDLSRWSVICGGLREARAIRRMSHYSFRIAEMGHFFRVSIRTR